MPKPLIGRTFSKLTVLEFAGVSSAGRMWACRCECGQQTIVAATSLYSKLTTSCGCAHYRKLPQGMAGARRTFRMYKQNAKAQRRPFELTFDEFYFLTSSNCFYCGAAPSNKTEQSKNAPTDYGTYIYNGIDRIDSTIGYVANNCVASCFTCNRAKHTMSQADFLAWAHRLVHHQIKSKELAALSVDSVDKE